MSENIIALGKNPDNFPQGKVEQLRNCLEDKYTWASNGYLELIATRNVLIHSRGIWNERAIEIIRPFVDPLPAVGDKLVVGVPMLFRYRKAMRTFLNETHP